MKVNQKLPDEDRKERKEVYTEIVEAFSSKYSFLGGQAAREFLMSAASWNVDKYSDPPFRYRNHVMLTWEPGWVKSTLARKMQQVLGEELVTTCGKLTAAVMRGSVEGGKFSPPAPMKSPIVISTEFGQTEFTDELLNTYLALLEEGTTSVKLNKIAGLSESEKANVEKKYDGVEFVEENEFKIDVDFVFWGCTHDPSLLTENALKSRFNVVTPAEPLTGEVTEAMDSSPPLTELLDQDTVNQVRQMVKSDKKVATDFKPPSKFYNKYALSPRESRDVQSYMAARNWWGLDVNPDIMGNFIEHLKESRRIADMGPRDRVKDLIFEDPHTFEEIMDKTGFTKLEIHDIIEDINARRAGTANQKPEWVIRSRDDHLSTDDEDEDDDDDSVTLFGD